MMWQADFFSGTVGISGGVGTIAKLGLVEFIDW